MRRSRRLAGVPPLPAGPAPTRKLSRPRRVRPEAGASLPQLPAVPSRAAATPRREPGERPTLASQRAPTPPMPRQRA
ncbi:hypothetical protein T484DRAFT_1990139, partial [Baffinella frigidus]